MTKINTATATIADIKAAETIDLVATYNQIMGKEIKKFRDRATAEKQTWAAIQRLAPAEDINSKKVVKAAATKPKKEVVGKRDNYENRIIEVLVKENPKRPGSRAHRKFEILMQCDGMTIREYKNKEGKFPTLDGEKGWPATEIRWSLALNLVKLKANTNKSEAA
jgi:hypothetical protein